MDYKDLWTSNSHRINADDSEKYMDEEDFKIAILEWESAKTVSRVELPVKPAIAGLKLADTFNELRKLFIAYEWFSNNAISGTLNNPPAAKETQEKIDNILRQLSV